MYNYSMYTLIKSEREGQRPEGDREMRITDDRKEGRKYYVVGGIDTFMSGWGCAKGVKSYAFWAVPWELGGSYHYQLKQWVANRGDIKRVCEYYPNNRVYRSTGLIHIYVVDPESHPAFNWE